MESMKTTISELKDLFLKRMSEFELELKKAPSTTSDTPGTPSEYFDFRTFILQPLGSLQQQVGMLAQSIDQLEMRGRRKILLLHGVTELKDEDTAQVVAQVVKDRLKLSDFKAADIKRCHRMGRSTTHKARPILFKIVDVQLRDKIWFDKTKLKGSGITVSEFLTKTRHTIFMAAREKFGVTQCWTREGAVYVLGSDGTRHRVISHSDLNGIAEKLEHDPTPSKQDVTPTPTVAVVKTAAAKVKRAAARK